MSLNPALLQTGEEIGAVVRSEDDARALVADFEATMKTLLELVEQETDLVRAGRLFAATDLTERKNAELGRYLQIRTRLKTHFSTVVRFLPDTSERLREIHLAGQEALRANLAVLAIAREVAEGIVRNVATTVGRAAAPATYGRNAAIPPVRLAAARGIAVDRSL